MCVANSYGTEQQFDTIVAYRGVRRGLEGAVFRAAVPTLSAIDDLELGGSNLHTLDGRGRWAPTFRLPAVRLAVGAPVPLFRGRRHCRLSPLSLPALYGQRFIADFWHARKPLIVRLHAVEPALFF